MPNISPIRQEGGGANVTPAVEGAAFQGERLPASEPVASTASQGAAPVANVTNNIAVADNTTTSTTPSVDDASLDENPAVANDVDVIEREWVEKAKAIVEHARSDPFMQEQKVSELQSDYLKKRYGKELKTS
jgi:hypothetical protein